MLRRRTSRNVQRFVDAALPFSHWGETCFDIRLMEYELADGLFNGVFSKGGDTLPFLRERPARYDLIFSHFVLEHVENLDALVTETYKALKPGGRALHVVPNTHDTIIQLLLANLDPLWENIKRAWRNRGRKDRCDVRRMGNLFAPITHSEFIADYRKQFEVNSSEHYLFPFIAAGFKVRDIKPMREHAYGILLEKPTL